MPLLQASASKHQRFDRSSEDGCDELLSPLIASALDDEDGDGSWGSWDDQGGPIERDTGGDCDEKTSGDPGLQGSAGEAGAAPPRRGTIRAGTEGKEEKENEHDAGTQRLGGRTRRIDTCKRDESARGDSKPRKIALIDRTNFHGTRSVRRPKKKSGGRITPNDPISRLSDGVGIKRVNGEAILINYDHLLQKEMTRRLVLQRTVGELRTKIDALEPKAGRLTEAQNEIVRLQALLDQREQSNPERPPTEQARGWANRRSKSSTLCISFKIITLGGILWLALVNMSVHSAVAKLLYQQQQFEGEKRRQAYLGKGVLSKSVENSGSALQFNSTADGGHSVALVFNSTSDGG